GIMSSPHLLHFTRFGALIFQFALLLSLLAFEDLFFGQIDIGYTSLKFLNKSRTTDILGSSHGSSQSQDPVFSFRPHTGQRPLQSSQQSTFSGHPDKISLKSILSTSR